MAPSRASTEAAIRGYDPRSLPILADTEDTMTTPDGLTAESEDEVVARAFHEAYERLAPQFGYRTREASAVPWEDVPQTNRDLMVATVASVKHVVLARHVRETGCDGLREALRRLIDAIETTGLHEHDDGRGGVDLCIPISGIRGVMNDACEAAGHEFLHPEDVPPFCRWCGAALAPTVAACAREGCGHEERHHRVDPDDIPWCWKDCPCPGYLAPSHATEEVTR